jgi:putative PIN family toxin of toxin-antitoxin system
MSSFGRLVVDTNVVLSALLVPGSVPGRALYLAQGNVVLASKLTLQELKDVADRGRFDRYVEPERRRRFVAAYMRAIVMVDIPFPIHACRDPRDDKFLEVAVHGHADLIVTGDADLLALNPFQGIAILTPAEYLERA